MHTEYFHRRIDLLVARLQPGERVLARGRAFAPEPLDARRLCQQHGLGSLRLADLLTQ